MDVVETDWPRHVPADVALCLYRVTQEALRNVVRHSGVHRTRVTLQGQPDNLTVPAVSEGYAAARDRIVARVERLVSELAAER